MAMEQGRVTEFEGKSLDQIQIEPEGRAVEILSQTDGLKETSSGEPSTIHPDAPHGSGSAPSERHASYSFLGVFFFFPSLVFCPSRDPLLSFHIRSSALIKLERSCLCGADVQR
uniref:Uncharacterized protein n=1 Tax=Knipowitschia caucasica TaxID=637954 RepID=A0AAV2LLT6_KNICA